MKSGDVISFKGMKNGCRGCLCFAGGIDVPIVMNSRSTHVRSKFGGFEGRALKTCDIVKVGDPAPLWSRLDGFAMPAELNPMPAPDAPLAIITGLQDDAFTAEGKKILFESEYTITAESDRMGCRLDGPEVAHTEKGADIVSDGIPLGAVQIPGSNKPIIMLADRQTTGGYTKIGVLTPLSMEAIVQKMPGTKVRFRKATVEEGTAELRRVADAIKQLRELRFALVSRPCAAPSASAPLAGSMRLTFNGTSYNVTYEEI